MVQCSACGEDFAFANDRLAQAFKAVMKMFDDARKKLGRI
jgi:hypothetical protein